MSILSLEHQSPTIADIPIVHAQRCQPMSAKRSYCGRHVPIIFRFTVVCHRHAINARIYLRAASCERSWRPYRPLSDRQVELLKCKILQASMRRGKVQLCGGSGQRNAAVNGINCDASSTGRFAAWRRCSNSIRPDYTLTSGDFSAWITTDIVVKQIEFIRLSDVRRLYANLSQLSFAVTMSKNCRRHTIIL